MYSFRSASEDKYRNLVENQNDIVFSVGVDGLITYLSPSATRLFGYDPEELIGQPFTDRIHPEDANLLRQAFGEVLKGQIEAREYRMLTKAGEVRWVRSSSRMKYQDGQAVGIQGVLTDITERMRTEELLRQAALEHEKAKAAQATNRLIQGLAHEVRNPLFALSANAQALARQLKTRPDLDPFMGNITTQVQRLSALMKDLVELGHPADPNDFKEVDLGIFARETVEAREVQEPSWKGRITLALPNLPVRAVVIPRPWSKSW